MRLYIIVCEAGDRSCHYWISTASLSLHTTQSAANACGQRDEREKGERTEWERMDESWEGNRGGDGGKETRQKCLREE